MPISESKPELPFYAPIGVDFHETFVHRRKLSEHPFRYSAWWAAERNLLQHGLLHLSKQPLSDQGDRLVQICSQTANPPIVFTELKSLLQKTLETQQEAVSRSPLREAKRLIKSFGNKYIELIGCHEVRPQTRAGLECFREAGISIVIATALNSELASDLSAKLIDEGVAHYLYPDLPALLRKVHYQDPQTGQVHETEPIAAKIAEAGYLKNLNMGAQRTINCMLNTGKVREADLTGNYAFWDSPYALNMNEDDVVVGFYMGKVHAPYIRVFLTRSRSEALAKIPFKGQVREDFINGLKELEDQGLLIFDTPFRRYAEILVSEVTQKTGVAQVSGLNKIQC